MGKSPEYIEFLKSRIFGVKPEIADLMIEYALTPEEHKNVLRNIEQYCFTGMQPEIQPKLFLVIGQTGGGKSTLTAEILKKNPNTVVIDSDAFKAFNPKRQFLTAKFPTLYGCLTGLDAYLHRDEIYQTALKNGYNILMEVAPSTKDRLFNIDFEELKKYGYQIDANVLSVSLPNSLLSVHERFEGQIEAKMEAPKLTDFKRANDSFYAVEVVLNDLINMPDIDLNIWQRGLDTPEKHQNPNLIPSPIFITSDKTKAMAALQEARKNDEEITIAESDDRIKIINAQMRKRKAPTEQRAQFAEVEKIISELQLSNN